MNSQMETDKAFELLLIQQQQIHENIKLADQKATQIMTIDGVLLGILFHEFLDSKYHAQSIIAIIISIILLIGIGYSIYVIYPRGNRGKLRGEGVIDPARIVLLSLDDFLQKIRNTKTELLVKELRIFIYDRSFNERVKYKLLRIAIITSAIGWIIFILFAATIKMTI